MAKQQVIRSAENTSRLEQLSGEGQGNVFEVFKERMTIGRSEECDIVLKHDSVSRVHASIEKNGEVGFLIFDNESKNGIYLNGSRVEASPIKNGDSIQIGIFSFLYHGVEAEYEPANLELVGAEPESKSLFLKLFKKNTPGGSPANGNKRLILYGGLAALLAVVYFYKPDEAKKEEVNSNAVPGNEKVEVKFSEKPETKDLSKSKGLDPALEDPMEANTRTLNNPDLKDSNVLAAEQYFKMGLREYSNKNYQRAIDNFRSALTLSQRHPLAKYYLDLAIFESEDAAKKNRELAIQYYRTMNYERAIYYCKEVIAYLQHNPAHPSVKTCKEFIENARQINQAAELAP